MATSRDYSLEDARSVAAECLEVHDDALRRGKSIAFDDTLNLITKTQVFDA